MKVLYFAYGSNMLSDRLIKRISSVKSIGRAKLNDWRVAFNKKSKDGSGKANLLYSPGHTVWGVVYELDRDDLGKLDKFEEGYNRKTVQVQLDSAEILTAETYISDILTDDPVASDQYKQFVVSGASEHNLPVEYIQYLQRLPSKGDTTG